MKPILKFAARIAVFVLAVFLMFEKGQLLAGMLLIGLAIFVEVLFVRKRGMPHRRSASIRAESGASFTRNSPSGQSIVNRYNNALDLDDDDIPYRNSTPSAHHIIDEPSSRSSSGLCGGFGGESGSSSSSSSGGFCGGGGD